MDISRPIPSLFTLAVALLVGLPLNADDTIYTKVDVNPVPVKTPPPDYPTQMKRDGIAGVVALSIVIDETGAVTECTVTKSTRAVFDEPALTAIKKWKFKPAKKDGNPVKMRVTIPIRFDLDE